MVDPIRLIAASLIANGVALGCYADCPPPSCASLRTVVIVGAAPGSPLDVLGRSFAQALNKRWGASGTAIVENRVGGGGLIAAQYVATAPSDGSYALLANSALMAAPAIFQRMPFSFEQDLVPTAELAAQPYVLVTSRVEAFRSIEDLIAMGRQSPGKLTFASSGSASLDHIITE